MMFIISRKDRVAEGILECKCGSSKIISTQVQSKSRDEAMSIFARCSIVKRDGKNQLFTILVNKFKMSTIIKDNRIRTRFIKIPMLKFKSHVHLYI